VSVSHWGIFPGCWAPEYVPGKGYPIGGGRAVWQPLDWHDLCIAFDAARERIRQRRLDFLDGK
jgi:hypothetical protein